MDHTRSVTNVKKDAYIPLLLVSVWPTDCCLTAWPSLPRPRRGVVSRSLSEGVFSDANIGARSPRALPYAVLDTALRGGTRQASFTMH